MRQIKELKNKHKGQDIWVIAAGASMNYIDPSFFENKITIGINRVCMKYDCDYLVAKDGRGFNLIKSTINDKTKIVLSKYESGNPHSRINTYDGEYWIFEHPAKPGEKPDTSCIKQDSDKIVVSYSTITSGIHLAAYLGASNIMICGHDCGTLDSESTIKDYYKQIRQHHGSDAAYVNWLSQIENDTALVCETLKRVYKCNVHSLNPFINFNLEGHEYKPSNKNFLYQRKI